MNEYLERLNALTQKKPIPQQPSKPSKGAYEGFEGDKGERILGNIGSFEGFEGSLNRHVIGVNDVGQRSSAEAIASETSGLNSTDRYCHCKRLATLAIGRTRATRSNPEGVERWLCQEHFDQMFPDA